MKYTREQIEEAIALLDSVAKGKYATWESESDSSDTADMLRKLLTENDALKFVAETLLKIEEFQLWVGSHKDSYTVSDSYGFIKEPVEGTCVVTAIREAVEEIKVQKRGTV